MGNLHHAKITEGDKVLFEIVHDFEKLSGNINSFESALICWDLRHEDKTAESLIKYIKSKEPHRIIMTLEEYEKQNGGTE